MGLPVIVATVDCCPNCRLSQVLGVLGVCVAGVVPGGPDGVVSEPQLLVGDLSCVRAASRCRIGVPAASPLFPSATLEWPARGSHPVWLPTGAVTGLGGPAPAHGAGHGPLVFLLSGGPGRLPGVCRLATFWGPCLGRWAPVWDFFVFHHHPG